MYKIIKTFHKNLRDKYTRPIKLPSLPIHYHNTITTLLTFILLSHIPWYFIIYNIHIWAPKSHNSDNHYHMHKNNNNNNPFVNTLAQSKNIHPNLGPWQTLLDTSPPHWNNAKPNTFSITPPHNKKESTHTSHLNLKPTNLTNYKQSILSLSNYAQSNVIFAFIITLGPSPFDCERI